MQRPEIIAHGNNSINHTPGAAFRLKINIDIKIQFQNIMIKNINATRHRTVIIVSTLAHLKTNVQSANNKHY